MQSYSQRRPPRSSNLQLINVFQVQLHSTGIKDPRNKVICQIADIVWSQDSLSSAPPDTGVLLPGTVSYKKYVQYFAEKTVSSTNPALFSDNNYSSNNARSVGHRDLFILKSCQLKELLFCQTPCMSHKYCLTYLMSQSCKT